MTSAGFILRKPVEDDAPAILACHRDAILHKARALYGPEIVASWAPPLTPDRVAQVAAEIADADNIYLVAVNDDAVLGFGIVVARQHKLRAVYVRPNKVGKVGMAILQELLTEAKARQLAYLEMDASANAADFYAAHGFRTIASGTHKLHDGIEMACVKMRIDL